MRGNVNAMVLVLQKAVTPAMALAYLTQGYDRVGGYVVRAAEVSGITAPADLRILHHLDHEGSLYPRTGPLYILHVDRSPNWELLPASARTIHERPEFETSGIVEVGEQLVEEFYLDHSRLTTGARLWRFNDDASPVLVGTYLGPALGWQDHTSGEALHAAMPTATVGMMLVLEDKAFVADVNVDDDGRPLALAAVAPSQPPAELGFTQPPGSRFWTRPVRHDEVRALFELRITATYHDLPVQLTQQFRLPDGSVNARLSSMARDWEKARDAGFLEVELGVWEKDVPMGEVAGLTPQEIAAESWMTPWQRERARAAAAAPPQGEPRTGPTTESATLEPGTVVTPAGEGLGDARHLSLYQRIAQGVIPQLPSGATSCQILCETVGNVMELSAQAFLPDDSVLGVAQVSQDVARAFGELRALGAVSDEGAWFGALVSITAQGELSIRFNKHERPRMRRPITAEMLRAEREHFPRAEFPGWFTELEQGLAPDTP